MTSRKELVFLLEEESAKAMLEGLLPKVLHKSISPRFIVFEGKQDLEKQMVNRIRFYMNTYARFIVMRDQDSAPDPTTIKSSLMKKCEQSGKDSLTLIRIACRELESFYFGDLASVESGLGIEGLVKYQNKAKYRNPDDIHSPGNELMKITKNQYQKVSGSRAIGPFLEVTNQRSTSFKNLILAIQKLEGQLLALS
ncbi:DUF4276 family protein [Polynucleobacter rarus]|uniref:DUF4276 family protein n=1 Tax=Polynucleobacter rarus TaxID=556055 RepID=UPI000D3E8A9C|nr:DUF4276 family protein [Polynucleobacter rarus]